MNSMTPSLTPSTLLHAAVLAEPDEHVAFVFVSSTAAPHTISRREFAAQVRDTAAALHKLGVGQGDVLVIAHTQNVASIYAFWAAVWLGAVPTLFPTRTEKLSAAVYDEQMRALVHLSAVRAVLTSDEFVAELAAVVDCPIWGESVVAQAQLNAPAIPPASPAPHDIALLQHSSGTTGLQKGVALSHAAVLGQLTSYAAVLSLTAADVIVSWLPLYHDMGLIAGFLLPLVQGVPLILMSPFDWVSHPALLFQAIHDYHGTLCWLPNFAYNHCARRIRQRDVAGLSLASMRGFINCSEPVRAESHALFLERFAFMGLTAAQLAVSYAMAENVFAVTQTLLGRPPLVDEVHGRTLAEKGLAHLSRAHSGHITPIVSCGPPIPGTEISVVDDENRPLPDRHVGQIIIRSPYMLSSYHRRPDLQPFHNGWYATGDRGYMANGEVYVVGRLKDLIINAGKNIYPQDIEAIVNTVAGIHPGRAVAFGVPDAREGTELIAIVAEVEGLDTAAQEKLSKAIRLAVAQQSMVTASYVTLVPPHWLIKTSSGKLARAANRAKWQGERGE